MIPLRTILDAVRAARASRDFGIAANCYVWSGGRVYAQDGRIAASVPCPLIESFEAVVPGDELDALIARLPDEISVSADGEKRVLIKAGRLRGSIEVRPVSDVTVLNPNHEWQDAPQGFVAAIRLARPFVSEVAAHAWATAICLRSDMILATNNISLIQVAVIGLAPEGDILLPAQAADFIIKAKGELVKTILNQSYAAFLWNDGLTLMTKLIDGKFSDAVGHLLGAIETNQPVVLTAEWKKSYADVAALSENIISIERERISGGTEHSKVEYATMSELKEPVHLNPKYATPVIEAASAWNPMVFPKPIPFVGEGFKGLLVGRRA